MGDEPVAVDEVAVGVELAEKGVGERHLPGVALDLRPILDDFRPFDLHLLAGSGLIDDALGVRLASRAAG